MQEKSLPCQETRTAGSLWRLPAGRGAGGSRTHDGGFAIRCLSHLATAPISRNPLPHSRLRKAGTGGWEANYDARSTISVGVN